MDLSVMGAVRQKVRVDVDVDVDVGWADWKYISTVPLFTINMSSLSA